MPSEIIDVCQRCGHYIEPVPVPGTGWALVLCQRNECLAERSPAEPMRLDEREPWVAPALWQACNPVVAPSTSLVVTAW